MHQGFRKELWTKLVEVLVIDEISMLSGEWFDNLDRTLRELAHWYGRGDFQTYVRTPVDQIPPFGGIQVVVVGDLAYRDLADERQGQRREPPGPRAAQRSAETLRVRVPGCVEIN